MRRTMTIRQNIRRSVRARGRRDAAGPSLTPERRLGAPFSQPQQQIGQMGDYVPATKAVAPLQCCQCWCSTVVLVLVLVLVPLVLVPPHRMVGLTRMMSAMQPT